MYHLIDDLIPHGHSPRNLQLYFFDTDAEVDNRVGYTNRLDRSIVSDLVELMSQNPYAQFFRSLKDVKFGDDFVISLNSTTSLDQRVYNLPTASQVAAIWLENDSDKVPNNRSIKVYACSGRFHNVQYYYGCYDPLQYPLLFPLGETGWHEGIDRNVAHTYNKVRKRQSCIIDPTIVSSVEELIATEESIISEGKKKRTQQDQSRIETYQGLVDSVGVGATTGYDVGRRIILPVSFIGGPRDMRRRYMDAMSLVQRFGKPDLFLTMTCNPNWPEIKELLCYNDEAHNRPDLLARVFRARVEGYKVQAMTYANEIDIFDNKLSLNATYIITDAIVSIPRGNLVLPDERYNCLWTLTRKCTVAVVPDEDKLEVMEDPEIDEIPFSHFHKYINTMKKISVMAIVIHKLPRKHVDSKNGKIDAADFVLVDKQALSNSVTLHSLILTNAFNDAYLKLADLSSEQFVTIADVKSSIIEGKRYCIYASIQIPTKVKKFYYIACDGCWKGTIHNLGEEFECSYCGNSMAIAKPRCMMTIELTENNDFLESVLFGNIVEELLSVSASKLVDMDKKNETIDMQNVKEKLDNKTFKVELLCKKQNFRGTEQVRYSIISLQEQKKIAHAKRVKRKLIYDDTDDNTSDEHSKAFGDFDNEVTDKKSKLVKLG
nr:replication protein A 70 kDa DNA-binding subunit E-like [Ipomoea batatas]